MTDANRIIELIETADLTASELDEIRAALEAREQAN